MCVGGGGGFRVFMVKVLGLLTVIVDITITTKIWGVGERFVLPLTTNNNKQQQSLLGLNQKLQNITPLTNSRARKTKKIKRSPPRTTLF